MSLVHHKRNVGFIKNCLLVLLQLVSIYMQHKQRHVEQSVSRLTHPKP